jgi:hypothetical protein
MPLYIFVCPGTKGISGFIASLATVIKALFENMAPKISCSIITS